MDTQLVKMWLCCVYRLCAQRPSLRGSNGFAVSSWLCWVLSCGTQTERATHRTRQSSSVSHQLRITAAAMCVCVTERCVCLDRTLSEAWAPAAACVTLSARESPVTPARQSVGHTPTPTADIGPSRHSRLS